VHFYIGSGSTEYDHLMVVARALEMMGVHKYYKYIIKFPKDQQREPKCKGCTLSFQRTKGGV
jgi:hypothetical protein